MLTPRQRQLLKFIQAYVDEHEVPPSFEEMRDALQLKSKSGIHRLIGGLEERGFLRRLPYRARAIELVRHRPGQSAEGEQPSMPLPENVLRGPFGRSTPRPEKPAPVADEPVDDSGAVSLPLYGSIAAGLPIEALCDSGRHISVPADMIGKGEHYALEIVGDSMIEAGILDGDTVLIERCDTAGTGEIVVALIDESEATLKRLRKRNNAIALEAANPAFETRIFGADRVRIQGKLVGLLRRY
ncbi:MAG: transcriptional repressor LexA [Geminicoccaceae bacterium]